MLQPMTAIFREIVITEEYMLILMLSKIFINKFTGPSNKNIAKIYKM
jgi:hypothetical protein